MLAANSISRAMIPSVKPRRLLRVGMANNTRHPRDTPAALTQKVRPRVGSVKALFVAAVVEIVSVAAPAFALGILTGLVDPKLKVGGSCAPVGLDVIVAVNTTLPVKPPAGDTLMVEVFPEVAPGNKVTAVPATVKLGVGGVVTSIVIEFEAPV
jgi:hypothetical protein